MREEIENILLNKGINPTPIRILVYKSLIESDVPLSLMDLEIKLDSVDKSTISRTLSTFKDTHVVHPINDGSGSMKYEICKNGDSDVDSDRHVHFRCEKCGVTHCLTDVSIPLVSLPDGFKAHEFSYIITGVCAQCSE